MYKYSDIRKVQIEITEKCNAACPACGRNFYGYGVIPGLLNSNMSLEEFKFLINEDLVQQLYEVAFCGNLGDAQLNPNLPDIIDYLYSVKPSTYKDKKLTTIINTNGSMHDESYWANFAKYKNMQIWFAVDGTTQEVHSYYRQNTNLEKVLSNAKAYIDSGGQACMQFILFKHNEHQLNDIYKLGEKLGFHYIDVIKNDRPSSTPIFTSKKEHIGILEDSNIELERKGIMVKDSTHSVNYDTNSYTYDWIEHNFKNSLLTSKIDLDVFDISAHKSHQIDLHKKYINRQNIDELNSEKTYKQNRKINCGSKLESTIYITVDGFIYPCCMLGNNHTRIATEHTNEFSLLLEKFSYENDVNNALKHGGIKKVFDTGLFDTIANTWIPNTPENKFLQNLNTSSGDCGNLSMCASACSNCDYNA